MENNGGQNSYFVSFNKIEHFPVVKLVMANLHETCWFCKQNRKKVVSICQVRLIICKINPDQQLRGIFPGPGKIDHPDACIDREENP